MSDDNKMPGPVLIDLLPTSCSLSMGRTLSKEGASADSLCMGLKLSADHELRTPDGRSLNGADWAITFYGGGEGNSFTERHSALGMVNYFHARESSNFDNDYMPESCFAWVHLDLPTFRLLRSMAIEGRLPNSIRLQIMGIEYGWEPDGSGLVWDVSRYKNAAITQIELNASLVSSAVSKEADELEPDGFMTPTAGPGYRADGAIETALAVTNRRLAWVVILLVAAIAVFLLR